MIVRDILEHFLSRADWVDRSKTVDKVIVGDPEKDVDRCLVTWMPSFAAIRYTVEQGVPMLLCHEPTFWDHMDDRPKEDAWSQEKLNYIKEHDLVILRNHDCWDRWPQVGIPWAWARFLELGNDPAAIIGRGWQHRYDIDALTVDELAARIALKCASIGEPQVQVVGGGSQMVSKIGIGTGCGCDIPAYIEMGCDCSIVCDDGSCYWSGIQRAKDFSHPVIRVNHGTSEEPGMVTMTKYVNDNIDGLRAELLPHGSMFRLAGQM